VHDAVLSVLIKVDGIARAVAQVEGFDEVLEHAGGASDKLSDHASKTARDVGKMGDASTGASRQVNKLGAEIEKASKATDLWQDAQGRWRNNNGRFASDAEKAAAGVAGAVGGMSGAVSGARGVIDAFGGGMNILVAMLVLAGPIVMSLAAAAFALGAALAPLVGLAGAAGVALSAFAQAAGVIALASMGVGDALKEQIDKSDKAGKAAISSADQQRGAARAIQQAQEGVRQAHERVTAATENLARAEKAERDAVAAIGPARRQAQRDLEDLRSSLVGAQLDEMQAARGLQEARDRLAEALRPADVNKLAAAQSALTSADLNQQQAVLGLKDAQQRLNDLMKPADALTVADAQDQVADSIRDQTRAANDLVKAQAAANTVNANPAATDQQRADAALSLADAQNAIGDAARARQHAEENLAKLQAGPDPTEVAKAQLGIATAQQAITDATAGTAKAQQDLQTLQAGTSAADIAKDRLDVAQAEHTLADAITEHARVQHDLTAAEKAGVNGSAQVVEAEKQAADAHRQVVAAQRALDDANRDVAKSLRAVKDAQADAASGSASAALASANLDDKFSKLPLAAQAFVRELIGMKPKLDEIRSTAAAGLFPGVIDGMHAAMGSFDSVNKVTGETGRTLGHLADQAGQLVGSSAFGKDIETVGHRNTIIMERVGHALFSVAGIIRDLIVTAGPLTTWLAKVTEEWAANAEGATDAARKSGALSDFFQKTRNTLIVVVSILANLATAFFNVGKAAAPFGRDILKSIDDVTGRFKEWTSSVGGQRSIQDFFKETTQLVHELMPAIGSITQSMGGLAFRVLPVYVSILNALGPIAGPLVATFIAFKLALTGAEFLIRGIAAAQALWNLAMSANPIAVVVLAIAALAAGIIYAYKHSETFREIVNNTWTSIKTIVKPIVDWLAKAIPDTWDAIKKATEAVWPIIRKVTETEWNLIKGFIINPVTAAAGAIDGIWRGMKTGAETAWGGIKTAADTGWGLIKSAIIDPVSSAVETVKGLIGHGGKGASGLVGWLSDEWGTVKGVFDDAKDALTGAITAPFKEGLKLIGGFAKKILQVIDLIPGVDMAKPIAGIDKFTAGLAQGGTFQAFANGGAFARTGGIVNAPITLMGEEAPRHPEFVIPTNPAYRGRAHGLLARAAAAIGFANGGVYTQAEIAQLWKQEGGAADKAADMSWISEAESGGNALINNGGHVGRIPGGGTSIAAGLYQILGLPFPGDVYDAAVNTRMAIAKSNNGQNLHPWDASRSVWGQHVGHGGILGAIGHAVTGAVDAVTGAVSALNPLNLIRKLPDTQGLGWLEGVGKYALDKAGDWIKAQILGTGSGVAVANGKTLQLPATFTATHQTAGLPGYPAIDVFGAPGTEALAPADGVVSRFSGHPPSDGAYMGAGGPFGWSMYLDTALGSYFLTHFGSRAVQVGDHVSRGQVLGTVGDYPGAVPDHIHEGLKALARGGMFGGLPFAGSFGGGGIVPGPVGKPYAAVVHGGEEIGQPGRSNVNSGPLVVQNIEHYHASEEGETVFARELGWNFAR
jgi:murein DD-endopeptidase MepM/ murein hydrolase activator NlpD